MRKEDVRQVEAFEMWIRRRMDRAHTNKEVLKKMEEKRSLMDIVLTRAEALDGVHYER